MVVSYEQHDGRVLNVSIKGLKNNGQNNVSKSFKVRGWIFIFVHISEGEVVDGWMWTVEGADVEVL